MRQHRWLIPFLCGLVVGSAFLVGTRAAVGPSPGGDGTYNLTSARVDKTGSAVVQQSGGKYGESSLRQLTFTAGDQGAGVTPVASISTTANIVLYNPQGNNLRFRVQKVSCGYVSGTLQSGTIYHCAIISQTQTAPSGGTLRTNTCLDIGSGAVGTGVVRTGATVAAGAVVLRPFVTVGQLLATSVYQITPVSEDVDGEIVVEPGASYQLQGVMGGTGSSPLMSFAVTWTEEPIK